MHRLSERSTQPIDLAVAGRARQRRRSQWYFFTTSHGLEGEFLPCALALAKRRQWRGYDAVKLAAAYGSPAGCRGAWQIRHNKIEIRYHEPGLLPYGWVRLIHVVLMSLYCRTERSVCHAGTIYFIRTEGYFC